MLMGLRLSIILMSVRIIDCHTKMEGATTKLMEAVVARNISLIAQLASDQS